MRDFDRALEEIKKDFEINVEALEALARMYDSGYTDGYDEGWDQGKENEWYSHECDHTYCSEDNY